jgi:hypothetical protein
MRISLRQNDPGYNTHAIVRSQGRRASIKLNGEPQFHAVTADSDCGMVVRWVQPYVWDGDRRQLVDEVVHGKVEIEFHDEMVL